MRRRVVAKKFLPPSCYSWLKEFKGKDVLRGYRKHYHASWSCAIIELTIMGVFFPAEDIEEAHRRQVQAVISVKNRKAKKAKAKAHQELAEYYPDFALSYSMVDSHGLDGKDQLEFGFDYMPDQELTGRPDDDYDPFAD